MIRIARASEIRHFHDIEDLQKEVWKFSEREIIPRNELITVARNGGVVLGAWDGPEMVGFVFGFAGIENRRLHHASRMLAVRESYRREGLGRKLKYAQRRAVLAQGIKLMTWTFDPLQSRNAHLNIAVLGGTARDYYVDTYGPSTSVLNRGLPTDRLLLRWDLKKPRGKRFTLAESEHRKTVAIPVDVNALRARDPKAVLKERFRIRAELQSAFRAGWEIEGFASDGTTASRYVLKRAR